MAKWKKKEGKRTKKPYYYFTLIPTSFPFGALMTKGKF